MLRQNTLDTAGYAYDPLSTNCVFGNPNPFVDYLEMSSGMPKTRDDSMMPQFSDRKYQKNIPQGSSGDTGKRRSARDVIDETTSFQLILFVGIVAVALWL